MKRTLKKIKELNAEKKFIKKISLFFAISAFAYIATVAYEYYLDEKAINDRVLNVKKHIAEKKVQRFDNVESKIFDLSKEDDEIQIIDLEDLSNNQGVNKISVLEKEIAELKLQIEQLNNFNYSNSLIIAYVHLRQKMFSYSGENVSYYEELKNFEILSQNDEFLQDRIRHLQTILRRSISHETLLNRFEITADRIVSNKEVVADSDFLKKVKANLLKIIIIRKVDEKNQETIDGKLAFAFNNLRNHDYMTANRVLLSMDNEYKIIAAGFIMDLNYMIALQRIDNEILNYLQNK